MEQGSEIRPRVRRGVVPVVDLYHCPGRGEIGLEPRPVEPEAEFKIVQAQSDCILQKPRNLDLHERACIRSAEVGGAVGIRIHIEIGAYDRRGEEVRIDQVYKERNLHERVDRDRLDPVDENADLRERYAGRIGRYSGSVQAEVEEAAGFGYLDAGDRLKDDALEYVTGRVRERRVAQLA